MNDSVDRLRQKLAEAEQRIGSLEKENDRLRGKMPKIDNKQIELMISLSNDILRHTFKSFDEEIIKDLEVIARFTNADACIVVIFNKNNNALDKVYRWLDNADNKSGQDDFLSGPEAFKSLYDILEKNDILVYNKSLADESRLFDIIGKGLDFKSGFIIPLQLNSDILGAIGFANYIKKAAFSSEDINLIRLIGNIFLYALIKKQNEDCLQTQLDDKDKILGVLTHELHLSLKGLLNMSESLSKDFVTLTLKEIRSSSNRLYQSSYSLVNLLENLMNWSRIEKGIQQYDPETFNLREAVFEVFDTMKTLAEVKKIELIATVPEDVQIYADRFLTGIIIRSLISNAIMNTAEAGFVLVDCGQLKKSTYTVNVKDNGSGMSEFDVTSFLEDDQLLTGSDARVSQGNNWVLQVCKELIRKNRGEMMIDSHSGVGSTISFTVPAGKTARPHQKGTELYHSKVLGKTTMKEAERIDYK